MAFLSLSVTYGTGLQNVTDQKLPLKGHLLAANAGCLTGTIRHAATILLTGLGDPSSLFIGLTVGTIGGDGPSIGQGIAWTGNIELDTLQQPVLRFISRNDTGANVTDIYAWIVV